MSHLLVIVTPYPLGVKLQNVFFFFFFSFNTATAPIKPWPSHQFASRYPYPLLVSSILL